MRMWKFLCVAATALFSLPAISANATDARAPEIASIYAADQSDRDASSPDWNAHKIDWPRVHERDAARRTQVKEILAAAKLKSAEDYYHAAVVFQHGETNADIELAHALAVIAIVLDPAPEDSRYMVAATWDRFLMRQGKPQWYGTQYIHDKNGKWALYEMDLSAVDDDQRRSLAVPTLAEARARVDQLNNPN